MPETHEIVLSIDKRLAEARKEIASLEAALTAMSKSSKAASTAASPRTRRPNRTTPASSGQSNGAAPAASRRSDSAAPAASGRSDSAAPAASGRPDSAAPAASGRPDSAAPAASGRPDGSAPSRRARRAKPAKRGEVVPAGKLEALLSSGDGMSTSELAERTGGDRQQVLTLLRELEAAGQVRRSGDRRNTRWHAITDEDRIAARVAELERQSKRASRTA
jgi:DNA-binding transcriptional ArsR family regulator